MLRRRPDRIDHRADDADRVSGVRRVRNSVARGVVSVPGLRLKRQKDGHPLLGGQKLQNEAAILPHAVIAEKGGHVALVHVDVVNAESGQEAEDLVRRVWLGAPALAKGIDDRVRFLNRGLLEMLELIVRKS